jgi:hypothetical protein
MLIGKYYLIHIDHSFIKYHDPSILFETNIHLLYQQIELFIECSRINSKINPSNYSTVSVTDFDISNPIFRLYPSSHPIMSFITSLSFFLSDSEFKPFSSILPPF